MKTTIPIEIANKTENELFEQVMLRERYIDNPPEHVNKCEFAYMNYSVKECRCYCFERYYFNLGVMAARGEI